MGLLDKFKKLREKSVGDRKVAGKVIEKEKKEAKKPKKKEAPKKKEEAKPKILRKESADTGLAYHNLIKPMVSEKSSFLTSEGKYVFVVHPDANKIEIKKAVQKVYNVRVRDVKIINMRGKSVRFGRVTGRTKDWKKAIVGLESGDKIELYEGV
ncbi:50S ribosomal protein L23 [Candidatus Saccharibacteria bacterium]|nr:50S ribosomal protein L23 [Candidatus Saccharibacteria bacterium]NIV03849.1 50S ribosomal protein L23 [Calditrichia bacterium]NIS38408.1 50S ribosomal protein L23 [Candidatus Saccharibacteria bacterium]NIV72184.1 50S ribosomal protein L23 [Calditrichia bacterium]NIV99097.1 50S ribosomal protein L23 [Candidatus Saccharibacteria bacterium]